MAIDKSSKQFVSIESENTKVAYESGSIVRVPFSSVDEVVFTQDASSLVVASLDGARTVKLENFFVAKDDVPSPVIELGENGALLTIDEIISNLDDFNPEEIAPAAGPGAGGGGASFSSYRDDAIGEGIGIGDLLAPTDLTFSSNSLLEEASGGVAEGSIVDTDDTPSLIIGDASADEGDGLVFDVSLSTESGVDIVLNLTASAPGSATAGTDYETNNFEVSTDGGLTWGPAGGDVGNQITFDAGTTELKVRIDTTSDENYEGDETLTLTATKAAGSGEVTTSDTGTGTIIDDDFGLPQAQDDNPDCIVEPAPPHAVFIMDTSASMSSSELQLMEDALKDLAADVFGNNSGAKITLIEFDSDANYLGKGTFTSLNEVLDALNDLSGMSSGSTNYEEALDLARDVEFEAGSQKSIYFLSDGDPYGGNTSEGIANFNDWVNNDLGGADVYSIGIGVGTGNTYLGQIDNTASDNDPGAGYNVVANAGELSGSLEYSGAVSGNLLDNDSSGPDGYAGQPIQSIEFEGVTYDLDSVGSNVVVDGTEITLDTEHGRLTIDLANGEYDYFVDGEITEDVTEVITYTIEDATGDVSSADLTICVKDNFTDLGAVTGVVSEAGLDGNEVMAAGTDAASDTEIFNGDLGFENGPALNFSWSTTVSAVDPETDTSESLKSDGDTIEYRLEDGGLTLVGFVSDSGNGANAGEDIFKIELTDTGSGDYRYTQLGPIDHPDTGESGSADALDVSFEFSGTNYGGSVKITVEDDAPTGGQQSHSGEVSLLDYSVAISIDISTSMNNRHDSNGDGNVNSNDNTRLDTAKESAIDLATELFNAGDDVAISLSVFADGSYVIGTYTDLVSFTAAVQTIDDADSDWADDRNISNSTNYNDAMSALEQGLQPMINAGQSAGTQKLAYFLSDGEHNESRYDSDDWQDFVSANGINAYAVAVGGDISNPTSNGYMKGMSFDPENASDGSANILVVDDPNDLTVTLTNTIHNAISGNVFEGPGSGAGGADGHGGIFEVMVFGELYTSASDEVTGTVLEVTDSNGHSFILDLENGDYQFRAADGASDVDTVINYKFEDNDGDQVSGSIDIDVDVVANAPEAYDNVTYVQTSLMTGAQSQILEDFSNRNGFDIVGKGGRSNGKGWINTSSQGNGAELTHDLEDELDIPDGTIKAISGLSSVKEGSAIVLDSFAANTGDVISFDWRYEAADRADDSFYILKNTETGALQTGLIHGGNDRSGSLDITVEGSGTFELIIGIVDQVDRYDTSRLEIDNVKLQTAGLEENVVSGNVLSDPMNDPSSSDAWGATDLVEFGTTITTVTHDSQSYNVGSGIVIETALGGSLKFNADGSYEYTAPTGITGVQSEEFDYTLRDISGDEAQATLTINVVEDDILMNLTITGDATENTLNGGSLDNVILGMADNDILNGNGGNDYLNGGTGDDTLSGGDDADRFVYQSVSDGIDLITDFDVLEGDQISLDSLFDEMGISGGDNRAALIEISDQGSNQELTIQGVDDFKIVLENSSSLTLGDAGTFTESDLQGMKIVVDES